MINKLQTNQLANVLSIWLETSIEAHPQIPRTVWEDALLTVKEALPLAEVWVYQEDEVIKGFIGITNQNTVAGLFVLRQYQRSGIGTALMTFVQRRYSALPLYAFMS